MRVQQRAVRVMGAVTAAALLSGAATAQPVNDQCASATPAASGAATSGNAAGATSDGASDCNFGPAADVYHSFVAPVTGTYTFSLCAGTAWDTVISLHTACPATIANEIACDDEGCRPPGATDNGYPSSITVQLQGGQSLLVRISGYDGGVTAAAYSLLIVGPAPAAGGCCLSGSCTVRTSGVCQTAGATYRGDYTACYLPSAMSSSYPSPGGVVAIPDNSPAGVLSTITVPDGFLVGDIQVLLTLTHTYCGDLIVLLSHAGRTVALFERIGGGQFGDDSNFSGNYVFNDSAFDTIWHAAVDNAPGTGAIIPNGAHRTSDRYSNTVSLRQAFDGLPAAGDWVLNLSDNTEFDTGSLDGWTLTLDRNGGDPCALAAGACCFGASCSISTLQVCSGENRHFAGAGIACNVPGELSTPCCKGDFNQTGSITVQDIFDYLLAYFTDQPSADTNDAGISVQDLFDFLRGYFAGCS